LGNRRRNDAWQLIFQFTEEKTNTALLLLLFAVLAFSTGNYFLDSLVKCSLKPIRKSLKFLSSLVVFLSEKISCFDPK
jgi:hypothetical protein